MEFEGKFYFSNCIIEFSVNPPIRFHPFLRVSVNLLTGLPVIVSVVDCGTRIQYPLPGSMIAGLM